MRQLRWLAVASVVQGASAAYRWQPRPQAEGPAGQTRFDAVDCKKCMMQVMRLLVPGNRGCLAGNGTMVPSSTSARVPTAYCDTLLPKKRQCQVYSFGVDSVWDFDRAMVQAGCRVVSFDPFCCGAAHRLGENHEFVPVGLATYDGLAVSDASHDNSTFPVLSLRSIMDSLEMPKIDILRMKVSSRLEWKGLKNLVNLGTIQEIRQLSLNLHLPDDDMWEEYKTILTGLKTAGFVPFYVQKQADAQYLNIQEGTQALHSRYEVSYGYTY